ncbi:hypothetical protein KOW79_019792 [Hemibagrus wyckioides]|uniref:C2H2-type domain-containing protein n=1 Tax=Hemibagrus wyckioides TaxID=337641 RepID=A0A9D3S9E0_9TELE|nr:hypothetical protein KOW79_019792 [Hemibagrus wyckioides]
METCTISGGETSDSMGHVTDLQEVIKKEDSSVCREGRITQETHVKKEEPEEEDYLCDGTSNFTESIVQLNGGFHGKLVKEEETEDEDYPHAADMNTAQVLSCSWCSLSFTSQIYLHKHIERCHYEEYENLKSGEIKYVTSIQQRGK